MEAAIVRGVDPIDLRAKMRWATMNPAPRSMADLPEGFAPHIRLQIARASGRVRFDSHLRGVVCGRILDRPMMILLESSEYSLPLPYRSKERDDYAGSDDGILMVVIDRSPALDVVMGEPVRGKGELFARMAVLRCKKLAHTVPHDLKGDDSESVVAADESARKRLGSARWSSSDSNRSAWRPSSGAIARIRARRNLGPDAWCASSSDHLTSNNAPPCLSPCSPQQRRWRQVGVASKSTLRRSRTLWLLHWRINSGSRARVG
jgi:hypothetical protein